MSVFNGGGAHGIIPGLAPGSLSGLMSAISSLGGSGGAFSVAASAFPGGNFLMQAAALAQGGPLPMVQSMISSFCATNTLLGPIAGPLVDSALKSAISHAPTFRQGIQNPQSAMQNLASMWQSFGGSGGSPATTAMTAVGGMYHSITSPFLLPPSSEMQVLLSAFSNTTKAAALAHAGAGAVNGLLGGPGSTAALAWSALGSGWFGVPLTQTAGSLLAPLTALSSFIAVPFNLAAALTGQANGAMTGLFSSLGVGGSGSGGAGLAVPTAPTPGWMTSMLGPLGSLSTLLSSLTATTLGPSTAPASWMSGLMFPLGSIGALLGSGATPLTSPTAMQSAGLMSSLLGSLGVAAGGGMLAPAGGGDPLATLLRVAGAASPLAPGALGTAAAPGPLSPSGPVVSAVATGGVQPARLLAGSAPVPVLSPAELLSYFDAPPESAAERSSEQAADQDAIMPVIEAEDSVDSPERGSP